MAEPFMVETFTAEPTISAARYEEIAQADVEAGIGGVVEALFVAWRKHVSCTAGIRGNGHTFLKFELDERPRLSLPIVTNERRDMTMAEEISFEVTAPAIYLEIDASGEYVRPDGCKQLPVYVLDSYPSGEDPDPRGVYPGSADMIVLADDGRTALSAFRLRVPHIGGWVGLYDLMAAYAVQDADRGGDAAEGDRIWSAYFGLERMPPLPAGAVCVATTGGGRSARVKTRVLATSDVAHRLPFETEFTEIRTADNAENDIITRTTVELPDGITTGRPINQTGVNILNSALSHWMEGVTEVSEAKFCKFVYGTTEKPSSETLARMAAQVESLMVTPVTIEKTEELRGTGIQIPDGERDYIKTTALHAEIFMRESANGRVSRWYRFIEPPALLRGAAESNQLGSISQVAYERIMDGLRGTELNMNIANYLIRRCGEITNSKKRRKKLSPMVSYETLYGDVTGDDWSELDRHAQKRVRDTVWHVMDGLQAENRFYQWWEYRNTGEGAGRGERLTTTHKSERTFKQGKRIVKRPWFETARKAGCEKKRADGIEIRTAAPSKQRKLTGNGEISK